MNISPEEIKIRTVIKPGDLGYVIHRHGKIYADEYDYGVSFEVYVANGIYEFYQSYDPEKDRVWICEHHDRIIGFLLLMHRENNVAQLRYFYIEKDYRAIGLGKKLMELYMDFYHQCHYNSSYLWTTHELEAAASLYIRHGFTLTEEVETDSFGKKLKERRYDLQS